MKKLQNALLLRQPDSSHGLLSTIMEILRHIKIVFRYFSRVTTEAFRILIGIEPYLRVHKIEKINKIRLGTKYGGWTYIEASLPAQPLVVSCGLGEDASFDIEFASRHKARIIIVDPTPRAIKHFNLIDLRLGQVMTAQYNHQGKESISSYDLHDVGRGQLHLCPKAIWNSSQNLKFYAPKDPSHVSHSILNIQHAYSDNTPYITVQSITIDQLAIEFAIDGIDLIKLDIEGAEIEVLTDMLNKHIYPKQILVEYDELLTPSKRVKDRISSIHNKLLNNNYLLVHREGRNFTYLLQLT